jgi:DNA invertase Pin-like site-specific DNA recombinase
VPKGSYLLVENLDRVSRDEITESLPLFFELLTAGITVVTLTNQEAYSKERLSKDQYTIYGINNELIRANQESFYKGQRVADAKERNRARLAQGMMQGTRPYTRQTPGWIRWSDEKRDYELIPERAEVIRLIFGLADQGWGLDRIARELNRREVDTWGKGKRKAAHWRGSYLRKIVHSQAPIGLFTHGVIPG